MGEYTPLLFIRGFVVFCGMNVALFGNTDIIVGYCGSSDVMRHNMLKKVLLVLHTNKKYHFPLLTYWTLQTWGEIAPLSKN